MKWYHPFECDNTVKHPFVCDYDNLEENGFSEWDFMAGKKIKNWKDTIIFQAKKKKNNGDPDDALQNHLMLPIYTSRFINTLNKAKISGIQYLPITLFRTNGDNLNGFCIANFLNFVEALDLKKSDYDRFSDDFVNPNVRGKISGIRKYVLLAEKVKGLDIVRIKDYDQAFFVSEKFKQLFEENNFTGYSFREVELTSLPPRRAPPPSSGRLGKRGG
jgi:hypothetical protein